MYKNLILYLDVTTKISFIFYTTIISFFDRVQLMSVHLVQRHINLNWPTNKLNPGTSLCIKSFMKSVT